VKSRTAAFPIIRGVVFLAGEWVPAWLGMSVTFLVAGLGVAGLGWWVLRKDKLNRAAEEAELAATEPQPKEPHH
jgi:glucose dehydrogenase